MQAFHLIIDPQDLIHLDDDCKWCSSMRPWFEMKQRESTSSSTSPTNSKLDVNAPEFVPAARKVAPPSEEIYATSAPKAGHTLRPTAQEFKPSVPLAAANRQDIMEPQSLNALLDDLLDSNKMPSFEHEYVVQDYLRREETRAAIQVKARQLATDAFNETLLETIPRLLEKSKRQLANSILEQFAECDLATADMGQTAIRTIMRRMGDAGWTTRQEEAVQDIRLDMLARYLEKRNEDAVALEIEQRRTWEQEDALLRELESTRYDYDSLEAQMQALHAVSAHVYGETTFMRTLIV